MKKIIQIMSMLVISILIIGCTKTTGGDTRAINAPTNNSLELYGTWKIQSINLLDEELDVFEDVENIIGKEIDFSNEEIRFIDNVYLNTSYKLKVVNRDYILSYESNLKIEKFMGKKEKIDVISIMSNNNIIGEFILLEEDKGYVLYMGSLIEVKKVSSNIKNNEVKPINVGESKSSEEIDYYNSDTGLMIALKKPRMLNNDGTYSNEQYRTLWISFKDGNLMPVIEKDNIIFPRMNGIWHLRSKVLEGENNHSEYFELTALDSKGLVTQEYIENKNTYRNITFIGNNYIGLEEYNGENFNNTFSSYKVVPIDNINSSEGLKIEDLYYKDINSKYEMEYKLAVQNFSLHGEIDYSNFTVKRKEGKWQLVGNLNSSNENLENKEYLLNLRPNSKMLNYDTLTIPWKVLKGEIPFIRDAYTSPNQKMAVILFEDNLAIYEIKDKMLKGAPLLNIDIGNEEVIMAEWSTGGYVEKWAKAFSDGIYITN